MSINRFDIENYARRAADAFVGDGVDLNDTITKLAREDDFTNHHVDRVVQNANILVNAALVKQARAKGEDPRITFPMANSDEVMSRIGSDGSKVADLRKEAQVQDLFTVKKQACDSASILDGTLGKIAPDPYSDHAVSVDHVKLASDFVSGEVTEATSIDSQSLALACRTLESMEKRATNDMNMSKNEVDDADRGMHSEIKDQMLYGLSPATIRDVVKSADLSAPAVKYLDRVVTKVGSELRAREGTSAFASGSLVNGDHSILKHAAVVVAKVEGAIRAQLGLEKLSSAHKRARGQYARAVREGR